jgi:serine/threonine protein kinase
MLIANRYEPTGPSANGGMGDVIQCRDTHLDRSVVIKSLQPGVETSRLLDEQRALSKLRSKHVVQLFDVVQLQQPSGSSNGLVLEYIAGSDLPYAGLTVDHAYMRTLWQIASGLRDIHAAGVIHRDLKPNNIRVDLEGVVKIIDFGLARSTGLDDRTRSIIGTPVFMAPELWGETTISFNTSIDVYAFGVSALALVSTAVPAALQERPPQPVSRQDAAAILAGLPDHLIDLIVSCLAANPADRPAMAAVAAAMEKHLLYKRHRAIAVINNQPNTLDAASSSIAMKVGSDRAMTVRYDGHGFVVSEVTGPVYLNNMAAKAGTLIPGCCVITFGNVSGQRTFVTFDISNPEVIA